MTAVKTKAIRAILHPRKNRTAAPVIVPAIMNRAAGPSFLDERPDAVVCSSLRVR